MKINPAFIVILTLLISGYTTTPWGHWLGENVPFQVKADSFIDGTLTFFQGQEISTQEEVLSTLIHSASTWKTYTGALVNPYYAGSPLLPLIGNLTNEVWASDCIWPLCVANTGMCATTFSYGTGGANKIEADIIFWGDNNWATQGNYPGGGLCHLKSTGIHEFGHFFGLGHVCNMNISSCMQSVIDCDPDQLKTSINPGTDDINGMFSMYGKRVRKICRASGYINSSAQFSLTSSPGCETGIGQGTTPSVEYSSVAPAIDANLTTATPDFFMSWIGLNRNINIRTGISSYDGSNVYWNNKQTFSDTSAYPTSVAYGEGYFAVAFTGQNGNQNLNILIFQYQNGTFISQWKKVFWDTNARVGGSPSAAYFQKGNKFVIVWADRVDGTLFSSWSAEGNPYSWSTPQRISSFTDPEIQSYQPPKVVCLNTNGGSTYPWCEVYYVPTSDNLYKTHRALLFEDSELWHFGQKGGPTISSTGALFYYPITTPPSGFWQSSFGTSSLAWPQLILTANNQNGNQTAFQAFGTPNNISWINQVYPASVAHCRYSNRIEISYNE